MSGWPFPRPHDAATATCRRPAGAAAAARRGASGTPRRLLPRRPAGPIAGRGAVAAAGAHRGRRAAALAAAAAVATGAARTRAAIATGCWHCCGWWAAGSGRARTAGVGACGGARSGGLLQPIRDGSERNGPGWLACSDDQLVGGQMRWHGPGCGFLTSCAVRSRVDSVSCSTPEPAEGRALLWFELAVPSAAVSPRTAQDRTAAGDRGSRRPSADHSRHRRRHAAAAAAGRPSRPRALHPAAMEPSRSRARPFKRQRVECVAMPLRAALCCPPSRLPRPRPPRPRCCVSRPALQRGRSPPAPGPLAGTTPAARCCGWRSKTSWCALLGGGCSTQQHPAPASCLLHCGRAAAAHAPPRPHPPHHPCRPQQTYKHAVIEPGPKLNLVLGPNGAPCWICWLPCPSPSRSRWPGA